MNYIDQVFDRLIAEGLEKHPADRQEIEAIDALYKRVIRAFRQHKVAESAVRRKIIEPEKEAFRHKPWEGVNRPAHRSWKVFEEHGGEAFLFNAGSAKAAAEAFARKHLATEAGIKVSVKDGKVVTSTASGEWITTHWRIELVSVRNLFEWRYQNWRGEELVLHAKIDLDLKIYAEKIPHHAWLAYYQPDGTYKQGGSLRKHVELMRALPGRKDFSLREYERVSGPERITGERIA